MSERAPIRCVVVEDEPLAADMLGKLIAEEADLVLAGAAASGREAVAVIDRVRPDLVFLDIRIPDFSGLEVLRRIKPNPMRIVFTTAYDEHAIAAFELGAIDYLLKPFGKTQFMRAVDRARALAPNSHDALLPRLSDAEASGSEFLERLYVRAGAKIIPISLPEVRRFEAEDGFVVAHVADKSYHLDVTLKDIEARLNPAVFARVHRAHLVNLDRVRAVERRPDRRLRLVLENGDAVIASRTQSKALRRRFKRSTSD